MNTEEWGVTERGFHRPTYVELLDAVEYKARELFGNKANLTVRSPLGVFLRIFAWMLNLLFCLMEETYNSRFVDTAVGTSLYNLGKAIGLSLLPAQKASGYVTFTGAAGTPIPTGFLVRTVVRRPHRRPHRVRWHRHPSCSGRRNRRGLQCGSGPDLGDHQPAGRR